MSNALNIRLATPYDDTEIGELLVRSFVETYALKMPEVIVSDTRKADLRNIAPKRETGAVFVAERNSEILGTVSLFPPHHSKSEAWLPNAADLRYMAVNPDCHRQGIAGALLLRAIEQARTWKAEAICLHVRRGAQGIARFYGRYGFLREENGDLDLLPEIFLEAYALRL